MGDNRERPVGEASSGQAWVSVTEGWADPLRTEADYEFAQNSLIKYFTRNVRDLTEARTRDVVAAAVTRFRALWHAGVPVQCHVA
jgi:dihydroneopterin aldolase